MAFWAAPGRANDNIFFPTTATSMPQPLTVVASATPNVKGAWTQIFLRTFGDWYGMVLDFGQSAVTGADSSALLDIGVGAAGSERVVMSNIAAGYVPGPFAGGERMYIPLFIPNNTRLSIRVQSVIASANFSLTLTGIQTDHGAISVNDTYAYCTTYGANTANSQGTVVTSGASNNASGTKTTITAATTAPIHALSMRMQGAGTIAMVAANVRIRLWEGPAPEVKTGPESFKLTSTAESIADRFGAQNWGLSVNEGMSIPVGSRLAVDTAYSAGSPADSDIILYGYTR